MRYFTVFRQAGPGWTEGGVRAQPAVGEHAEYMNALAQEGFVLFGGPLGGSEEGRIRVLLVVDADSEAEIRRRLADDPWTTSEQLELTSIVPWNIFVGADRLSSGAD
jgi:uncharacterized protein YciI